MQSASLLSSSSTPPFSNSHQDVPLKKLTDNEIKTALVGCEALNVVKDNSNVDQIKNVVISENNADGQLHHFLTSSQATKLPGSPKVSSLVEAEALPTISFVAPELEASSSGPQLNEPEDVLLPVLNNELHAELIIAAPEPANFLLPLTLVMPSDVFVVPEPDVFFSEPQLDEPEHELEEDLPPSPQNEFHAELVIAAPEPAEVALLPEAAIPLPSAVELENLAHLTPEVAPAIMSKMEWENALLEHLRIAESSVLDLKAVSPGPQLNEPEEVLPPVLNNELIPELVIDAPEPAEVALLPEAPILLTPVSIALELEAISPGPQLNEPEEVLPPVLNNELDPELVIAAPEPLEVALSPEAPILLTPVSVAPELEAIPLGPQLNEPEEVLAPVLNNELDPELVIAAPEPLEVALSPEAPILLTPVSVAPELEAIPLGPQLNEPEDVLAPVLNNELDPELVIAGPEPLEFALLPEAPILLTPAVELVNLPHLMPEVAPMALNKVEWENALLEHLRIPESAVLDPIDGEELLDVVLEQEPLQNVGAVEVGLEVIDSRAQAILDQLNAEIAAFVKEIETLRTEISELNERVKNFVQPKNPKPIVDQSQLTLIYLLERIKKGLEEKNRAAEDNKRKSHEGGNANATLKHEIQQLQDTVTSLRAVKLQQEQSLTTATLSSQELQLTQRIRELQVEKSCLSVKKTSRAGHQSVCQHSSNLDLLENLEGQYLQLSQESLRLIQLEERYLSRYKVLGDQIVNLDKTNESLIEKKNYCIKEIQKYEKEVADKLEEEDRIQGAYLQTKKKVAKLICKQHSYLSNMLVETQNSDREQIRTLKNVYKARCLASVKKYDRMAASVEQINHEALKTFRCHMSRYYHTMESAQQRRIQAIHAIFSEHADDRRFNSHNN